MVTPQSHKQYQDQQYLVSWVLIPFVETHTQSARHWLFWFESLTVIFTLYHRIWYPQNYSTWDWGVKGIMRVPVAATNLYCMYHLLLSKARDIAEEDRSSQNLKEKLQAIGSVGLVEIWHHMPFAKKQIP